MPSHPTSPAARSLVLGTAGHIDHGKTALVRALTGIETDRLPDEKKRGITIDLGFAWLDLDPQLRVALVDVPGHERFIRNMLAGATGLDAALLVIAADDSVMPQTREHLEILRLLGLPAGIIALAKCDLASPEWLDLVEEEIRTLVQGSFLQNAPIIRTSAATGAGIPELHAAITRLARSLPPRQDLGLFRMAIDRAFSIPGHGAVVTGTIASGSVTTGQDVVIWPNHLTSRVRGLRQHDQPADSLARGARAAVNLASLHHDQLHRGQVLAEPDFLASSYILSAEIFSAADAPSFGRKPRERCKLHVGTAEIPAVVAWLEPLDPQFAWNAQSPPRLAQLLLAEPVATVHSQPFVLRAESPPATLAGGRVLQPVARRIRKRDALALQRLHRLRSPDDQTRLIAAIAGYGLQPWSEPSLVRDTAIPLPTLKPLLQDLATSGTLIELPLGPRRSVSLLAEVVEQLEDRVLRALARLHAQRPRQATLHRSHLIAELPDLPGETLLAALLDRLAARKLILLDSRSVARADHQPKLTQSERKLKSQLAEALRSGGLSPPDLAELESLAAARAPVVKDLLAILCDEGRAVAINNSLWLDFDAELELRARAQARIQSQPQGATVADLRDAWKTTRKFAVPFAEYLDRIHFTQRSGDLRTLAHPNAT
jgi:selenocysteine-specific elongation factor